jgi:hypothetical protein
MRLMKLIFGFGFMLLLFAACNNNEDCRAEKTVNLNIGFYTESTTASPGLVAKTIDSITVKGLGRDSILYNNKKNLKALQLPLRKFYEQTDFEITFNNIKDTISVFYRNNDAYFLSLACGCIVVHEIDEVTFTQNAVKDVLMQQNLVNNISIEHVKVVL